MMKSHLLLTLLALSLCFTQSCTTQQASNDSSSEFEEFDATADASTTDQSEPADELSEELGDETTPEQASEQKATEDESEFADLEVEEDQNQAAPQEPAKEVAKEEQKAPVPAPDVSTELSQLQTESSPEPAPPSPAPTISNAEVPPPSLVQEVQNVPAAEPEAFVDVGQSPTNAVIKALKFRGFENGGTLIVEGDRPLTFRTRVNEETNQFTIEVPRSSLSPGLSRPMITKDMASSIGSVDAYQSESQSSTSKIVVQLKPGAKEPYVTREGSSILVVAQGQSDNGMTQPMGIMSSSTLDDFLNNNTKFYGKRISIETQGMALSDVIRLISEESGVNIILSNIPPTAVNIRLRQVPWDQALAILLRTNGLGYTRIGDVLRVASLTEIRNEEKQALDSAQARKGKEPLKTRMIPINFADPQDIAKQIQDQGAGLVSKDRGGSVVENKTPKSLIVTETSENLDRIARVIKAIDVPPRQVLIEGKIIEATETFQRNIGINWGATGQTIPSSFSDSVSTRISPIRVTTDSIATPALGIGFELGTLQYLGQLNAQFSLYETQGLINVLASPRILTKDGMVATMSASTGIPINSQSITGSTITPQTTYENFPLSLKVKPSVKNDGSVEMELNFERTVPIASAGGGTPGKSARTASTNVLVKNGQTAVIAGLYQTDETNGTTKVPGLGDIPFLGWLFKSKQTTKNKTELMIFVTPKVVNHEGGGVSNESVDL